MDVKHFLSYSEVYSQETINSLEKEFSRLKGECYLDHAGATLYSNSQIKNVFENLLSSTYANPHSIGVASSFTHDFIEQMRYRILDHFHVSSEEYSVIFTSGATAALKIVAETFCFQNTESTKKQYKNGNFVYLQQNHTSVLGMRDVVSKNGATVICLKHDEAFEIFRQHVTVEKSTSSEESNSLFVYPAQCNFSGFKYPLWWIEAVQNKNLDNFIGVTGTKWYTFLDASSFVGTNDLDLNVHKADFVCTSFYKIFGYPTGLGALLVKNSSSNVLEKVYYGGGTVSVALSSESFHVKRENLHQRFEDGTLPFLSIIALECGFKTLSAISLSQISKHVFFLGRHLHHSLLTLHHSNGNPIAKIYGDTDYEDCNLQGGIVAFNILRPNGAYVGYMEVLNMAALYNIQLRTGCFCNPGACQRHLGLSNEMILKNYDSGYVCGGSKDLIDSTPTGCIRISFGYMSSVKDVETFLTMIKKCFLSEPEVIEIPEWWVEERERFSNRYKFENNIETNSINRPSNSIKKKDVIPADAENKKESESQNLIPREVLSKNEKIRLKYLFIYPIKSCAAFEIDDSWVINSRGLQYDREWMIVTSTGVCLTQKQEVNLCLIKPHLYLKRNEMKLTYPGMPSISISISYPTDESVRGQMCRGKVCGHKVEGIDCGTEVSDWLSLSLGRPNLRLVRQTNNKIKGTNEKDLSFASQAQYLLINDASISWLFDKIPDSSECRKETMLHRFRGNLIVSGCSPFHETNWKHIRIGNCNFQMDGLCTRCQMVCIDQTTGEKTVEPLRTLAEQFHGKLRFGIYLSRRKKEDAVLKIGDEVRYE